MRGIRKRFVMVGTFSLLFLLLAAVPVSAGHDDDPKTNNLHPLGHIEEPASLLTGAGGGNVHTDIAITRTAIFVLGTGRHQKQAERRYEKILKKITRSHKKVSRRSD